MLRLRLVSASIARGFGLRRSVVRLLSTAPAATTATTTAANPSLRPATAATGSGAGASPAAGKRARWRQVRDTRKAAADADAANSSGASRVAALILQRTTASGSSVRGWVNARKWKDERNRNECESLADVADSLLIDTRSAAAARKNATDTKTDAPTAAASASRTARGVTALEIVLRRIAGLALADETGEWAKVGDLAWKPPTPPSATGDAAGSATAKVSSWTDVGRAIVATAIRRQWRLHSRLYDSLDRQTMTLAVWNQLFQLWSSTGNTNQLLAAFTELSRGGGRLLSGVAPDRTTYHTLICHFALRERSLALSLEYFYRFLQFLNAPNADGSPRGGAPSLTVLNPMLSVLSTRAESVVQLQSFFDKHLRPPADPTATATAPPTLPSGEPDTRTTADIVSYNTLLTAYARRDRWDRVRSIWEFMNRYRQPAAAAATDAATDGSDAAPPATPAPAAAQHQSIAPNAQSFRALLSAGAPSATAPTALTGSSRARSSPVNKSHLQNILPFLEQAEFVPDESSFAVLMRVLAADHARFVRASQRTTAGAEPAAAAADASSSDTKTAAAPEPVLHPPPGSASLSSYSAVSTPLGLATPLRTRFCERSESFQQMIRLIHRMNTYNAAVNAEALTAVGSAFVCGVAFDPDATALRLVSTFTFDELTDELLRLTLRPIAHNRLQTIRTAAAVYAAGFPRVPDSGEAGSTFVLTTAEWSDPNGGGTKPDPVRDRLVQHLSVVMNSAIASFAAVASLHKVDPAITRAIRPHIVSGLQTMSRAGIAVEPSTLHALLEFCRHTSDTANAVLVINRLNRNRQKAKNANFTRARNAASTAAATADTDTGAAPATGSSGGMKLDRDTASNSGADTFSYNTYLEASHRRLREEMHRLGTDKPRDGAGATTSAKRTIPPAVLHALDAGRQRVEWARTQMNEYSVPLNQVTINLLLKGWLRCGQWNEIASLWRLIYRRNAATATAAPTAVPSALTRNEVSGAERGQWHVPAYSGRAIALAIADAYDRQPHVFPPELRQAAFRCVHNYFGKSKTNKSKWKGNTPANSGDSISVDFWWPLDEVEVKQIDHLLSSPHFALVQPRRIGTDNAKPASS